MFDTEKTNPADSAFEARLDQLVEYCKNSNRIDLNLYTEYDVKRGLRESNGKGVLTGLTEISDVIAFDSVDGKKVPVDGRLYYQGYNVMDLLRDVRERRFAFEEITYLLLFGSLPSQAQLDEFLNLMGYYRNLPDTFVRDIIMKAPSRDIMNSLQKSVLTLYTYDKNPDDISIPNVLKQSLHLIAQFPLISVYAYQAYRHYHLDGAGSEGPGRGPGPPCGARRRKQFLLHHPRGILHRHGHLLGGDRLPGLLKGLQARRRQPEGSEHVRRP